MKKNNWTTKLLLSGAVVALMLSPGAAFAGEAKYERHGRFVKHVAGVEVTAPVSQQAAHTSTRVSIDKGSLGSYVRQGRFVRRSDIGEGGRTRENLAPPAGAASKHEHGVNAKGHRNVSN